MLKRTPLAHTFTVLCVAGCLAVAASSDSQWTKTKRPSRGRITDMVVSGDDLHICTRNGGIFRTNDDGKTWEKISKGLPRKTDFQSLAAVEEGECVEPEAATAWMWYSPAASNGHQQAMEHLERLEKSLTEEELKRAERVASSWVEENL